MSKANVLVVEDEESVRQCTELILKRSGYDVMGAENSADVLKFIITNEFDAILLDFQLADTDGVKCAKMIHELRPKTPILMVTAWKLDDDKKELLRELGVVDFIDKPVDLKELISKIEQHVKNIK